MTIHIPASENVASGAVQNQEGKQCCLVVLVSAAGCSEVAHAALVSGPAETVDLLAHPIPLRKNLLSQVKGSVRLPKVLSTPFRSQVIMISVFAPSDSELQGTLPLHSCFALFMLCMFILSH